MELEPRFTAPEIAEAVERVATEMAADYHDKDPLMVGILTGSFVFIADLVRAMGIPVGIDFIRARSYGRGTVSSGAVEITKDI
jgi:hypoxanthine phosphoribosyltransferase